MWCVKRKNLQGIPVAVWALLLMALFSFGVFHYEQRLEMASFAQLQALEECVRESGYRLSRGYLTVERVAWGDEGVSGESGISAIDKARTTIQTCMNSLKRSGTSAVIEGAEGGRDLHMLFTELDELLHSFAAVVRERIEKPGAAPEALKSRQDTLYRRAEVILDDISRQLKLRRRLLGTKQRHLKTFLNIGWVTFAAILCLAALRIDWRGRRWERALADSEGRLRTMFAVFPDPVLVIDRNGIILDVPSPSKALVPAPKDLLEGGDVSQIVGRRQAASTIELIGQAITTGRMVTVEYEQEADGLKKYFQGRIMPIPESDPPQALWLAHDLTEFRKSQDRRIELERRMQQANKLQSLGVMAAGIAHDFDNLLTGVIGETELAMGSVDESSPTYDSLREIRKAASRAAELAGQMLKYAGHTHLAFTTIDMADLIRNAVTDLQPLMPGSVDLTTDVRGCPAFEGDYKQIYQTVRSLVLNAVEAIGGEKGRITIAAQRCTCTQEDLRDNYLKESHPPGDYVRLYIEDSGCGIRDEDYARLFDPFFTTKFTGRGLGLAAVQGIVRSHCGVIRVRSSRKSGTRFEVLFPVCKRDRATDESVSTEGGTV